MEIDFLESPRSPMRTPDSLVTFSCSLVRIPSGHARSRLPAQFIWLVSQPSISSSLAAITPIPESDTQCRPLIREILLRSAV